jgi:hypothetical protein
VIDLLLKTTFSAFFLGVRLHVNVSYLVSTPFLDNLPPPVALRLHGVPTEECLSEMVSSTIQNSFQALAGKLKQSLTQALVGEIHSIIQMEVQAVLQGTAGASQSSTTAEPPTSMEAMQRLNSNFPALVTMAPSRGRGVHQSLPMTQVPDSDPPLGGGETLQWRWPNTQCGGHHFRLPSKPASRRLSQILIPQL